MYATEIAVIVFGALVYLAAQVIAKPKAPPASPPEEKRYAMEFELIETKLSGLKSDLRKVSGEWVDYHSRLDTLIRRGIRLGVLEKQEKQLPLEISDNSPPPAAVPVSRAQLLSEYNRRHNAVTKPHP